MVTRLFFFWDQCFRKYNLIELFHETDSLSFFTSLVEFYGTELALGVKAELIQLKSTTSCDGPLYKKKIQDFIYLISERGEGREKERERNINVQEKHWSVASHIPTTGSPSHNPGMYPTGNRTGDLSICRMMHNPLSHNSQCYKIFLIKIISNSY